MQFGWVSAHRADNVISEFYIVNIELGNLPIIVWN